MPNCSPVYCIAAKRRLIRGESTTQISVRDADLSTEGLLAIARTGHSRSEEAERDVELDDD
jgi:hypothetical protein